MNVPFACPQCGKTSPAAVTSSDVAVRCLHCGHEIGIPAGVLSGDNETGQSLEKCLICGCKELYVRKNFSQRLGVAIIVLGIIASTVTWSKHMIIATFGIFFGSALLDVVLYMVVGNMLQCYRCHAEYRGVAGLDVHSPFSLETHERYRQQAARLAESEDA